MQTAASDDRPANCALTIPMTALVLPATSAYPKAVIKLVAYLASPVTKATAEFEYVVAPTAGH